MTIERRSPAAPHTAAGRQSVSLPLSPVQRAALQALYDRYQAELEGSTDTSVLLLLNSSKAEVQTVLDQDDTLHLASDTQRLTDLLQNIQSTESNLVRLKGEIAAISSRMADAAGVLQAIEKVLTVLPGL